MLYTKNIESITYQDVVDFCYKNLPEGVMLDYKSEIPKGDGLAKTISAFANTFGGLIVVGIADQDDYPKPPFDGMVFRDGLKNQIESIIVDNVNPIVFTEIKVCINNDKSRCFVVIRIPQSNLTPHAVMSSRGIYVRTGQRGNSEAVVHPDQIIWLFDKRNKSKALRDLILHRAEIRFGNFLSWIDDRPQNFPGILKSTLIPLYPQGPLFEYKDLEGTFINDIVAYNGRNNDFPDVRLSRKSIQDGIVLHCHSKELKSFNYIQLGSHGEYILKTDLADFKLDQQTGKKTEAIIHYYRVLNWVDGHLASALRFYKKIGYWGNLYLEINLVNLDGIKAEHPARETAFWEEEDKRPTLLDGEIKIVKEISINALNINKKTFIKKIAQDLAWSLGLKNISDQMLEQYLVSIGSIMFSEGV